MADYRQDLLPNTYRGQRSIQDREQNVREHFESVNSLPEWDPVPPQATLKDRLVRGRRRLKRITQLMAHDSLWLEELVNLLETVALDPESARECKAVADDLENRTKSLQQIEESDYATKQQLHTHVGKYITDDGDSDLDLDDADNNDEDGTGNNDELPDAKRDFRQEPDKSRVYYVGLSYVAQNPDQKLAAGLAKRGFGAAETL